MKTIIDQIQQGKGVIMIVYSDGTTEYVKEKDDPKEILKTAKIRGINKKR